MTDVMETAAPSRVGRGRTRLRRFWVPVVLVLASFVMGFTVTAHHSPAMSPIDEWVYSDYLYKLPQEPMVVRGEKIGPEALEIMSCHGVRVYGPMGSKCGDPNPVLSTFPQGGITSADAYTPIYFWITWAGAKAIQLVTSTSLVEAARLTGAFWLAAGMLLLWGLMRLFRVHPVAILGLGLAVIASPFAWWTYTFISTDAPSLLIGALLLIAATNFVRGHWSGWWIVLIGTLGTAIKISNILGVALVGIFLLVEFVFRRIRTRRRGFEWGRALSGRGDDGFIFIAVIAGIASVVVQFGWLAVQSALAIGPGPNQGVIMHPSWLSIGEQFVNFLPGTIVSNVHIAGSDTLGLPIPPPLLLPLSWLTVAGVVGAFALYRWRRPESSMVYAVAIASIILAPLLAVGLSAMNSYFPLPARYGAAILPGMLLSAGLIAKNRVFIGGLVAYSAILLVVVLAKAPVYA